jgi:hypothetical protein
MLWVGHGCAGHGLGWPLATALAVCWAGCGLVWPSHGLDMVFTGHRLGWPWEVPAVSRAGHVLGCPLAGLGLTWAGLAVR